MSLPDFQDTLLRRERRNWFSAPPNTSNSTQQEPDDDSIPSKQPTQADQITDRRRRSTNASSVTAAVTDLESQLPPEEELKPPTSNLAPLEERREKKLGFQITPRLISDATIGLSDGLTVPFALTAGLSTLGDTRVVIFGGLAELIAGAISMGLGGYLGAKSEAASYNETLAKTQALVDSYYSNLSEETTVAIAASSNSCRHCASISDPVIPENQDRCNLHVQSTTAQEHPLNQLLSQIFIPFCASIPQETLDSLTDHLLLDFANTSTRSSHRSPPPFPSSSSSPSSSPSPFTTSIPPPIPPPTSNQPLLVPFLMRFHHCLPPPSPSRPLISALTIATSYFLGGLLPLIPYFFVRFHSQNFSYNLNQYPKPEPQGQRQGGRGHESLQTALYTSIATMSLALFGFGYVKTCIVLKQWSGRMVVRKGVRAGVQMVVVGGIAAGAAMGLVKGFDGLLIGGDGE